MVVNRFMKKNYMNIYAVYAYKYSIHGSGRITLYHFSGLKRKKVPTEPGVLKFGA